MANVKKIRKAPRVPLGQHKLKLQLSDADRQAFKSAGWTPRWVNDTGGRIAQAKAGGYKFVAPDDALSLGESAVHHGSNDVGTQVRQVVSKGDSIMYGYLMKIRTKDYNEDQEAKWAQVDEMEKGLLQGRAGGAEIENTYLPDNAKAPVTMR